MKKCIFLALLGTTLACSLTPGSAAAQSDQPVATAATEQALEQLTRTEFNTASGGEKMEQPAYINAADVSNKAVRTLNQYFKEAGSAKWSVVNRSFHADFDLNGRKAKALFTKGGYMVYGIVYGQEQDLPKEDRRLLRTHYLDYKITAAVKVLANNEVYWITTLEDADNIVITRSHNGTFDELKFLQKHASPRAKKGTVIIPE